MCGLDRTRLNLNGPFTPTPLGYAIDLSRIIIRVCLELQCDPINRLRRKIADTSRVAGEPESVTGINLPLHHLSRLDIDGGSVGAVFQILTALDSWISAEALAFRID